MTSHHHSSDLDERFWKPPPSDGSYAGCCSHSVLLTQLVLSAQTGFARPTRCPIAAFDLRTFVDDAAFSPTGQRLRATNLPFVRCDPMAANCTLCTHFGYLLGGQPTPAIISLALRCRTNFSGAIVARDEGQPPSSSIYLAQIVVPPETECWSVND